MPKLTQKNIERIIYRHKRGESQTKLAKSYGVSRKRIYEIIAEYKQTGCIPSIKTAGRKKESISQEIREIIIDSHYDSDLGAVHLEKYIEKTRGLHISHNKIHEVLLSENLAKEEPRKKKQRKYRRYNRGHSMTLWHTDWKEIRLNGEVWYVTVFIDDCSRFIVGYGIYRNATTENTLKTLQKSIEDYGCPDQIITDNGVQYVVMRSEEQDGHKFAQFLKKHGIKHIRSRVHHPQTNGKVERFFREVEKRMEKYGSLEKVVEWQNIKKPHLSLGFETPEEVFWHALKPERILGFVNGWFWDVLEHEPDNNKKV